MRINENNFSTASKVIFNNIAENINLPKKRKKEEFEEQKALVQWLCLKKIPHFAIPNGGRRNLQEAKKLKISGVRPGVSDLFIMVPNKYHAGLFIEMKKQKNGEISEDQEQFIEQAIELGYCAVACNGWDEAKELTEK